LNRTSLLPEPAANSTFPLCINAAWTANTSESNGKTCQLPTTSRPEPVGFDKVTVAELGPSDPSVTTSPSLSSTSHRAMCSGSGAPPSFEMCRAQHPIPLSLMTLLPETSTAGDTSTVHASFMTRR
jgi:hypothetical protein